MSANSVCLKIGDRVRFVFPGHYRTGDIAEVLLIGTGERAGMVALGWEKPNSMGMEWCEPRWLEPIDGGKDADSYKLNPGGMRS